MDKVLYHNTKINYSLSEKGKENKNRLPPAHTEQL